MQYTANPSSESWSFANDPSHVHFCKSKAEVEDHFRDWCKDHETVGTSRDYARMIVFFGRHSDTTDLYPEFILSVGPRGGVRWGRA